MVRSPSVQTWSKSCPSGLEGSPAARTPAGRRARASSRATTAIPHRVFIALPFRRDGVDVRSHVRKVDATANGLTGFMASLSRLVVQTVVARQRAAAVAG